VSAELHHRIITSHVTQRNNVDEDDVAGCGCVCGVGVDLGWYSTYSGRTINFRVRLLLFLLTLSLRGAHLKPT
jgi:hypothetical protein